MAYFEPMATPIKRITIPILLIRLSPMNCSKLNDPAFFECFFFLAGGQSYSNCTFWLLLGNTSSFFFLLTILLSEIGFDMISFCCSLFRSRSSWDFKVLILSETLFCSSMSC
jgi:hypothetical protein